MSFRINTNVTAMNALRNLGTTAHSFSQSTTRLSTGMRINSAADDPSGLIFSENFRAQINGVTQAIRNNQDAVNYAKTAEGALDELSRLLRDGRTLAVASANTAVLDANQLQANQTQWNQIVASVNRIAAETQFGRKKLLDGSSGAIAAVVKPNFVASMNLSGTFNGGTVPSGAVDMNVTTAATKATVTGNRTVGAASEAAYLSAAVGAAAGTFSINGTSITALSTDSWADVITKINAVSGTTGVVADSVFGGGNGQVRLTSTTFGTKGNFTLADSGVLQNAASTANGTGVNAVATVTIGGSPAVTFTGGQMGNDGITLTDAEGNALKLRENVATGAQTSVAYVQVGLAQFQTGGNAGQRTSLNIGSFTSSALSIDNLDLTTSAGAAAALAAIDEAVSALSRKRGDIGSFSKNVLESNIRSLGVAKENLSSTESMIRDTDIAEEMTNYTKLQILQQSGLSVLAQANQAPQGVLSLLRG
ncbi:MAG: hypothetical protein LCH41_03015 [Armatimonadetes bacterium]|nr:hypothetical protein [Armatimonadota bacterium]